MIFWNEIKNLHLSMRILPKVLKSQIKIIRTWRLNVPARATSVGLVGGKKIFQQFSKTEPIKIDCYNRLFYKCQ
jgi:hypothetical protein